MSLVGSFTHPAWNVKLEFEFCPLRKVFVKYLSDIPEGTYLIKFLVDGHFVIHPDLAIVEDASGNKNNVIEIIADGGSSRYESESSSEVNADARFRLQLLSRSTRKLRILRQESMHMSHRNGSSGVREVSIR